MSVLNDIGLNSCDGFDIEGSKLIIQLINHRFWQMHNISIPVDLLAKWQQIAIRNDDGNRAMQ
jgi:hypothetical protein